MPFQISVEVLSAKLTTEESDETSDASAPSKPKQELTPLTEASVTLIPRAAIRQDDPDPLNQSGLEAFWQLDDQPKNYKHNADGKYVPDAGVQLNGAPNPALDPIDGAWLLVVVGADQSPVSQRLTLKRKGDRIEVTAGWKDDDFDKTHNQDQVTAETVHIFNYKKGRGPDLPPENALVTVTLFKRSELVSITGFDGGGTRFIRFAEVRRADLHKAGRANPGTRSAFFDVADGSRTLFLKAKQGWLPAQSKLPTFKVSKKPPPVGPDERMSILELYRYLDKVGLEAPGSVLEIGIFSHAFIYGPIIWNTFDFSDDDVNRDQKDLDGRSKDWLDPGLMTQFSDLKQCLADDGFLKVWGCNFDPSYTAKFRAANKGVATGVPADTMFTSTTEEVTENLNRNILKHQIELDLSGRPQRMQIYCSSAAKHLNKPCFGAPPGTGSNFINMRMTVVSFDEVYKYFEREFNLQAEQRDSTNHMNYLPFANVPQNPPTWSTEHWLMAKVNFNGMGQGKKKFRATRLPGKVAVLLLSSVSVTATDRFAKIEPRSGLVTPGLSGHLYTFDGTRPEAVRDLTTGRRVLFLEGASDEDCAIYVQSDRRLFVMRRDRSSDELSLDTRAIPVLKQKRLGEAWEDDPAAPPQSITGGALFVDDPETHW